MPMPEPLLSRRQWLQAASLLTAGAAAPGWAQSSGSARSITVAQPVDFSPSQQDVSRDFLIGSRAAWQDIKLRGGIRGRMVKHLTLETDGTLPACAPPWTRCRATPAAWPCPARSATYWPARSPHCRALAAKLQP